MDVRSVQPARPGWRFWLAWMLATLAGTAVGLIVSIPVQEILMALAPGGGSGPWTANQAALIIAFKGAEGGLMGAGMGLGQWLLLRKYLEHAAGWILATGLACLVQGAFRWSLPFDMPSWLVGVATTLSWGAFFGLFQWFVLRGRVRHAAWWIWINIAAWVPALASIAATELLGRQVEPWLSWSLAGVTFVLPFLVTAGAMVWLLRQDGSDAPSSLPSEPAGPAAI